MLPRGRSLGKGLSAAPPVARHRPDADDGAAALHLKPVRRQVEGRAPGEVARLHVDGVDGQLEALVLHRAHVAELVGDLSDGSLGAQVVRKMTDRYMQHVVAEADKQAIYALVLARGDVDILRAMLGPDSGSGFNPEISRYALRESLT